MMNSWRSLVEQMSLEQRRRSRILVLVLLIGMIWALALVEYFAFDGFKGSVRAQIVMLAFFVATVGPVTAINLWIYRKLFFSASSTPL